ncbi:MAG: alpha/beta hydrolase [Saprospiraceae bacterium]|jgi:pimeloyl-ACP methyl ester carboxylesterase|nr:alpha/beta hydrolase [Saprospiraceae bacterium]
MTTRLKITVIRLKNLFFEKKLVNITLIVHDFGGPIGLNFAIFIWGMKDLVIKSSYVDKFTSAFSNSKTVKLISSGHFPQEEEPDKVIQAMIDFLKNENHHVLEL